MSKYPAYKGLLALAMACATAANVHAQATVPQVLTIRPKSDDVVFSTPTPEQIAKCTLEVIKSPGGGSGYLLSDPDKQPLRKFLDTDGDGRVDTWSFYKDGSEVYREAIAGKGYTFRWMTTGGMKYGVGSVSPAGKAVVEQWRMISAEEAAQEAFLALVSGDFDRMKAVLISPQDIQSLGLPAAEAQKMSAALQGAQAKFQKTRAQFPGLATATFSRLEGAQPGAYPPDITGAAQDIIKAANGLILFENKVGEKKNDLVRASEMILVGNAWRLADVPGEGPGPVEPNQKVAKLLAELGQIDPNAPNLAMKRVQKLQEIADADDAKNKENWIRQIFDNLASAVIAKDAAAGGVLTQYKDSIVKAMPGSNLAAYGSYRELWANFQLKASVSPPALVPKLQEKYHEDLEQWIQAYPKADDTPDAMIQLATGSEFSGKEDIAKKWYTQISDNFKNSPNALKAAGAIKRLDAVGKNFDLSGSTLAGANYRFAPGKVTVVYYWASYSTQVVGDFAMLKKLQASLSKEGKDFDVVCVNLDDTAAAANGALQGAQQPLAQHLHQPGKNGGMDGPLATSYGIFGLPHMFLIDRDGKVVNNKAQTSGLEDEITKLSSKK